MTLLLGGLRRRELVHLLLLSYRGALLPVVLYVYLVRPRPLAVMAVPYALIEVYGEALISFVAPLVVALGADRLDLSRATAVGDLDPELGVVSMLDFHNRSLSVDFSAGGISVRSDGLKPTRGDYVGKNGYLLLHR